ncbi:XrtA system polysaccharide deacetylase [Alteromonas mediterranea]|uniref:Polysaccharide deacetylase n=1 Tax=Alteromonas mediterranea TaxID=314275 RepID=A0AAC8XLL5_9ALTE|nr:XrtA system polysaccharide deacetylase [Alteromonas mediterranea]AFV86326.1 polysaccharide deacetylase [Alteromonas mediterranea DE1]AGP98338.1 polysaccharide deacetylase [Alteromonas mediterranea UM7]AGQ02593.1 polysaccharide deacetylase [Alteromonas mediterranea UM4b]AMJ79321.1 polysaccharide deacetylase [Alteromonas mediterranea]AMJ83465.1 polysaccharide deacetylase [Alteromonas mediterranea]
MKLDNRLNAMTVDVEDYFQVSAFEEVINKDSWDSQQLRVGQNTHRLLDLFAEHNVKSTFFTLGWVAKRCPEVIKRIVSEGHELASHGLEHQRATTMTRTQFEKDVYDSKAILEDVSGSAIKGYRAPSFSVNDSNTWVYEVLVEQGFIYSSSTYPIEHDLYGVPSWPRFKYQRVEGITELPIPTIRKKNTNVGIGGGGFFRLYPYWLSKKRILSFMESETAPYSFYFHPWEIDPEQPYIKNANWRSKFRHYINLSRMESKIEMLLKDFNWGSMYDVYIK